MKHFLLFISACISMTVLFSACEKDEQVTTIIHGEPCIEPAQSIHEMKDWYYFKTGTYWVYKEQYSGLIDTIFVYENFDGVSNSYWYYYEAISTLDNFRYTFRVDSTFRSKCAVAPNCTCQKAFKAKWRPEDANYVGEIRAFIYPNYVGNYLYTGDLGGMTRLYRVADKYNFYGKSYLDVVFWDISVDASEDGAHMNYLIARNVGIIQKINYDLHEDWRLIDYFVIQ